MVTESMKYLIELIVQVNIRYFLMLLLDVSVPTGYLQRGHLQTNTFIINFVKDVHHIK